MTASGFPTVTVEVAFSTTNPLTTPGSWTAISTYVRGHAVREGRSHELHRTEPGQAVLELDNRDGRFDPTNVTGAYYPNVVPMRRIRIRAVQAGNTYDLFQGFITDWGQPYDDPASRDQRVTVQAVDAFALFALFNLSPYSAEVLSDNPVGYWRLREGGGTLFDDSSAGSDLTVNGTPTTTAGPLLGGSTGRVFSQLTGAYTTTPLTDDQKGNVNDMTLEFWAKPTSLSNRNMIRLNGRYTLIASTSSYLAFDRYTKKGGIDEVLSGTGLVVTGAWEHIVITLQNQLVTFYKNGVFHSSGSITASLGPNPAPLPASASIFIAGGDGTTTGFEGALAHVAIYNYALVPERILAHVNADSDTFELQDSGSHVGAVLDTIGWPAGERSVDSPGSSTIQVSVPTGPALDWLLQVAEDTENGLFEIGGDGKVIFHSRANLFSGATHVTSQATFGDGAGEIPYTDLKLRYDDSDVFGQVRVSRQGGTTQQVSDTTSMATYGPRTIERFGSLAAGDGDSWDMANYFLHRYATPSLRVEEISLLGTRLTDDTVWAQMLGRAMHHDRITVKRRPPAGNTITQDSNIEGVRHDVRASDATWHTTFYLTPSDTYTYWLLGDATYGLLGQTTIPAY